MVKDTRSADAISEQRRLLRRAFAMMLFFWVCRHRDDVVIRNFRL